MKSNKTWNSGAGPAMTVAVLTVLAFLAVLKHQFVSWDDGAFLYLNPHLRGLDWDKLRWMLTTFRQGPYQPLAWLSYGADYQLWGMDPLGFHLTNLILHTANAVLVFFLGRRLLANVGGESSSGDGAAVFAALFFALHPLRVEPVAWASARRDLLAAFFGLSALLCHLRGTRPAKRWAFLLYCLSLLAKPSAIGLPLIFAVVDREPRWKEKLPYLVPAAVAAVLAYWGQASAGAMEAAQDFGWTRRFCQAAYAHAFYLVKTVWPAHLAPMYEHALAFSPWEPRFIASAAFAVMLAGAAFKMRRRWPALWAAWLSYLLLLAPVLGLVKFGTQLAADRYSYLPCVGWSLLAAGLWRYRLLRIPACVTLLVLAGLTQRQLSYWQDSETLYRHILSVNPAQPEAHHNLGILLDHSGRGAEAMEHYRLAIQSRPCHAEAHNNLGAALLGLRQVEEAETHFRQAIACDPGRFDAYNNLALILANKKHYSQALLLLDESLRLNPQYAPSLRNRPLILRLSAKSL